MAPVMLLRPRILLALIALNASVLAAQISPQKVDSVPSDIAKWDLICFCVTSVNTPHFAVRADTNGKILYLARNGMTKTQLQRELGTPVLESQLGLLRDWRLLKRDGDVYTSNIPILGPEKIDELRKQMEVLANEITSEIRPDLQTITADLQRRNLSESLYSVLFSYVLDGLSWDQLSSRKAIPSMEVTADHPFWDGTFWAVYPKREAAPGTNSTGPHGITLLMTWTDPVLQELNALQEAPDLSPALQRVARGDCGHLEIEDKAHNKWNLGRSDGSCALPVIHEDASDPVYLAGTRIADRVAAAVLDHDLQKSIGGGATVQQAHLIETHELIWEMLSVMSRQGIVQQPPVLGSRSADPVMLLPLLVVTVQKQ